MSEGTPIRVLLVEDDEDDYRITRKVLRGIDSAPFEVKWVRTYEAALAELGSAYDVALVDYRLGAHSGLEIIERAVQNGFECPMILLTGQGAREIDVQAMRAGAADYLLKDQITPQLLERVIRYAIERKRAEVHLQLSEARYRRIVETTNEGVWLVDAGGKTTFVNGRLAAMLGCRPEEVLGRAAVDFVAPEFRGAAAEGLAGRTPGTGTPVELTLLRKDGTTLWVSYESAAVVDDPGDGDGVLVMVHDISERRRAQQALRTSEARFVRLSESGIVGIASADVRGGLHEANDTYFRTLGYSPEEGVAALPSWDVMTPPEWKELDALAFHQLEVTGIARPWEKEFFRKDGSRVTVLLGVATLDPPNCIAFMVDLSDRRRAEEALRRTEEQLRQTQKMEAVGRLAGGVAHDFNNLLSVVLGYNDMAIADLRPGDPLRENLEEVRKAGERAAGLTRQLLAFSRQQVLQPRVVSLGEVLLGMERMLARLVGEDVVLTVAPPSGSGCCWVDPGQIEQVVMNLVVNARDAMPTGGRLTLETSDLDLDETFCDLHLGARSGPYVMLAVTDSGGGMDEATRVRIFEPFFTTKEVGKGTGLGLSMVDGIVRQSGGTIWVYSEPGVGTTFKIYLPRVQGPVDPARPSWVALPRGGSETVLLVEDEDQVRAVTHSMLRRGGYRVLEARSAGDALLLCERYEGTIDLLLTDVVMPGVSGPELARRLAPLRPAMKVLFMSGYTDDTIVRHGVLMAGVAFLEKPLTPESVGRKVRRVLDAPAPSVH
ncbi:MAG: Blue-light-activated protein [Myxococcaceae bacterium]|nr:Blue-light-activated protein [Myxococcaceae bacterium]